MNAPAPSGYLRCGDCPSRRKRLRSIEFMARHPPSLSRFDRTQKIRYIVYYEIAKRIWASNSLIMNNIYKLLKSLEVLLISTIGEHSQRSACQDCGEIVM